jgi:hypothetical protein
VVGQILFTDCFLGWEFSTYGASVLSLLDLDDEDRIDPMSRVFPRVRNFLETHFIQILPRFYPEFIRILSGFYLDEIWIKGHGRCVFK